MKQYIDQLKAAITSLNTNPLINGWKNTLRKMLQKENIGNSTQFKLRDIELVLIDLERRGAHNKKRRFQEIRTDINQRLVEFSTERFKIDEEFIELITPFV